MSEAAVTIAEAAAMYSVSQKVIRSAISSGALTAKSIGDGEVRLHARIGTGDLKTWFAGLPDA